MSIEKHVSLNVGLSKVVPLKICNYRYDWGMGLFGKSKPKRVFLDYASTTPVAKEILAKMHELDRTTWANPSALYKEALESKEILEEAREKVAGILNAQKTEVIFTSGGTEANNIAILGVINKSLKKRAGSEFIPHIITTSIEHPSVLEVLKSQEGKVRVTVLPVNKDGLVSATQVSSALTPETVLVSVMYANNEIGTIQPIREIGRVVREYKKNTGMENLYFHTDASQAPLYLSLNVSSLNVDLLTLDGIKMYGPKVGLLYVKTGVSIGPVTFGGGQEKGLRSGTENVSASYGLAMALEKASSLRESESARLREIRDFTIKRILESFPEATLNGSHDDRLPNNINICFPGVDAEFAVIALDVNGVAASYSSSCRTLKEDSTSYVVESLGKPGCSMSSLRFTLGRETTMADIETLLNTLRKVIKKEVQ